MTCILLTTLLCLVGCESNINLQQRFEENAEQAEKFAIMAGRGMSAFISADTATEEQRQVYKYMFDRGVTQIICVNRSNSSEPLAWAFKTTKLAKQYMDGIPNTELVRIQNVIVFDIFLSYALLDGNTNYSNGYYLNDQRLLFISSNVDNIIIPNGITHICGDATYLSSAKNVLCNKELTRIGAHAFSDIKTLTSLQLNDGLEFIGGGAFWNTSLPYVVIPQSVEYIGIGAFENTILYCNTSKKPDGWHEQFANDCTVYWKGEWRYVDNVPQAK